MGICRREFGATMLGGLVAGGRLLAAQSRPKLLVLIIVEQLRPDYLEISSGFSPGGFRRLIERGAYFPDCRHLASSFPSTTVATLATGAWPAQHGIVADRWYDRSIRKPIAATDEALLATTLGAQVVAHPRGRVVVVGMDDQRPALFAGTPDARQFWMDDSGQFATLGDPPEWLAAFNNQKSAENAHNAKWVALNARPDAPALRTLNFIPERPQEFMTLYKASPFGQGAQFDFASELIARDKLGQGSSFDLLCLLVSSTSMLGYEVGGRSVLMQQMMLHLDRKLEQLLAQLSKSPGEKDFAVVLAGAHGAPPEPGDARDRMAVSGENVAQSVNRYLTSTGNGRVEKYLYPFVYLDSTGFRDPEPIRLAAARAALELPAVAGYYTAGGACSTKDEWEQRFRNSYHVTRSGDVMLAYQPEYVEELAQGRGVSYGSLYNYDIRVPLCFYGPQFRAGVFESPVQSVDVAPTLARVLGVPVPSSSVGRVLGEALVE